MVAVWAFEGPLSVLRAMGLNPRLHHHRPALWARWPFSRDRSRGREPETEHVALLWQATPAPGVATPAPQQNQGDKPATKPGEQQK